MSLFRVPRERVIDAVPVALVLILLSMIWFVPAGAPLSMLHIWLWLRHPRSKSRYAIFSLVLILYLGLFVAFPLVCVYLDSYNAGRTMSITPTSEIAMHLVIASSAGILPILYRMISRCTLSVRGEANPKYDPKSSRGSISDLLALSLLSAIAFFAVRIPRDKIDWDHSPVFDLISTLTFSAVGLFAMRWNARGSRDSGFAKLLVVWLGGYATLRLLIDSVRYVRDNWLDEPEWLSEYWSTVTESQFFFLAMFFVAVFPIICRRCAVTLEFPDRESDVPVRESDLQSDDVRSASEPAMTPKGVWSRVGGASGHCALLACISALTLYPFTWLSKYGTQGYRVAGWPLRYWEQEQVGEFDGNWYWVQADVVSTISFEAFPLVIDVLISVLIWWLIMPPRFVRRVTAPGRLRIARWAGGIVLGGILVWTLVAPMYERHRLESFPGIEIRRVEDRVSLGLIERVASIVEDEMFDSDFPERGSVDSIAIDNASEQAIDEAFRLEELSTIRIVGSKLSVDQVKRLAAMRRLQWLTLTDCDLPPKAIDEILQSSTLLNLESVQSDGMSFSIRDIDFAKSAFNSDKQAPSSYVFKSFQCDGELEDSETSHVRRVAWFTQWWRLCGHSRAQCQRTACLWASGYRNRAFGFFEIERCTQA